MNRYSGQTSSSRGTTPLNNSGSGGYNNNNNSNYSRGHTNNYGSGDKFHVKGDCSIGPLSSGLFSGKQDDR